jgi:hypothetical protein
LVPAQLLGRPARAQRQGEPQVQVQPGQRRAVPQPLVQPGQQRVVPVPLEWVLGLLEQRGLELQVPQCQQREVSQQKLHR